ncbi:MAG: sensor histidine kinase, partial [Pseudomonadales bacterium]|nr:sensor histidine kinase [Pseudomonadales bacterium]
LVILGTVQDITAMKTKESELLHSRELVRRLAAHNENIREEERTRIARELHDEMGQYLTAIRLDTALIEKRFAEQNQELAQMLNTVKNGIDASIKAIRDVATSLRPLALDAGLVSAAQWLLSGFESRYGIHCILTVDGEEYALDDSRTTAIFRILQESLTNIVRHANANRIVVRIVFNANELHASVSDNGMGFQVDNINQGKHFGLMGIRERVLIFGGTSMIDSEPGKGTRLSVFIPRFHTERRPAEEVPS